jgi:hypothetical protein
VADALVSRRLVAGGPDDFLATHHLELRGRQEDLAVTLAEEVAARFPSIDVPRDERLSEARVEWFAAHWPEHHRRILGIADAYGVPRHEADRLADLGCVPFAGGCSAVWCPADASDDGHARLGRNYDFTTASVLAIFGLPHEQPQPAMMSRPYVLSTAPDTGPSVAAVTAGQLSGCTEGMNAAGLVVALLADDETPRPRGTGEAQVGVDELQLPRLLLERCSTAAQAREVLGGVEHYTRMVACHYLIADATGDAIVWEYDEHGVRHVVEAYEDPLVVTNHLLHRYEGVDDLPDADPAVVEGLIPHEAGTYQRARTLDRCMSRVPARAADIAAALDDVRFDGRVAGVRTLWRTVFDLTDRTMTVEFYLGDEADGSPRRSAPTTIRPA